MLGLLLLPAVTLRERRACAAPLRASPFRAARELLASRHARRLLIVWFGVHLGMSAQGVIAPYMSRYVVERPELMGVMPALFIAPLIASVPLWVRWSGRFGRKRVWLLSMRVGCLAYALLFAVPPDDFWITGALLATAGFFTGCAGPVGPSFFASLSDAEAVRSGEPREGSVFAAKEFVEKGSSAAVALGVGVALQWAGFVPNVPQDETVQLAIRGCLGLLPGGVLLLSAVLLRGLDLPDEPPR
jgi:Na+/melibiose symporter-like transporter